MKARGFFRILTAVLCALLGCSLVLSGCSSSGSEEETYGAPQIAQESYYFDLNDPENITVEADLDGASLTVLNVNGEALERGTDYDCSQGTITIYAAYLSQYETGESITFEAVTAGGSATFTVFITAYTDPDGDDGYAPSIDISGVSDTVVSIDFSADEYYEPDRMDVDIDDENGQLFYRFDEAETSTSFNSELSFNRVSVSMTGVTIDDDGGYLCGAVEFDGKTGHIQLNNLFTDESQILPTTFLHPAFSQLSVSFWFLAEDTQSTQILYEQGSALRGVAIGLRDGALVAAVRASETEDSDSKSESYLVSEQVSEGWTHVALVFDGTTQTAMLYVNGIVHASETGIGSYIAQVLDSSGLGSQAGESNALGWNNCYYKGKMDELKIFNTAIEARPFVEEDTVYLQSAAQKNYYLTQNLASECLAEPYLRGWVKEAGAADTDGVSFRLTGTNKYIVCEEGVLSVRELTGARDKVNATFFSYRGLQVPNWGGADADSFHSYKPQGSNLYLTIGEDGSLTLSNPETEEEMLRATFMDTGDNTSTNGIRGAIYYPSYALNAPQFWKWYDGEIIEQEMDYAASIGINAFRIWVSYEYWLEDSAHFKAAFDDFLNRADEHGIVILVSLFEGCGNANEYGGVNTWSRSYAGNQTSGYAITSPSPAVLNDESRWFEPLTFVEWFLSYYKNDSRLMGIESMNEPWNTDYANRSEFAKYITEYMVANGGTVPISLGTAPSDAITIEYSVRAGVGLIQYHDNFPASGGQFARWAQCRIEIGRRANLPVYCTEVQWVGGVDVGGTNYTPLYYTLAPTCNELMETGSWSPFYWTLMVHPCYLPNNRQYELWNGLFYADGTVYSLQDIAAVAPEADISQFTQRTENTVPYDEGAFEYTNLFSDTFMDAHAYKWTAEDGNWSAEEKVYSGSGLTLANATAFSHFTATFTVETEGSAGIVFRYGEDGYYSVKVDAENGTLGIYKTTGTQTQTLASVSAEIVGTVTVYLQAAGGDISASVGEAETSAHDETFRRGQIGFIADDAATYSYVSVAEAEQPETLTLSGTITGFDGSLLSGKRVVVTANGKEFFGTSDEYGAYTVEGVPAAAVTVTVEGSSYLQQLDLSSLGGYSYTLDISLGSGTVTIEGELKDINGPLTGVSVTLNGAEGEIASEMQIMEDGSFTLSFEYEDVPSDGMTVLFAKEGYESIAKEYTVAQIVDSSMDMGTVFMPLVYEYIGTMEAFSEATQEQYPVSTFSGYMTRGESALLFKFVSDSDSFLSLTSKDVHLELGLNTGSAAASRVRGDFLINLFPDGRVTLQDVYSNAYVSGADSSVALGYIERTDTVEDGKYTICLAIDIRFFTCYQTCYFTEIGNSIGVNFGMQTSVSIAGEGNGSGFLRHIYEGTRRIAVTTDYIRLDKENTVTLGSTYA